MSLDLSLTIDTGGEYPADVGRDLNVTYNLTPMWVEMWGESIRFLNGTRAKDSLPVLRAGLTDMLDHPAKYRALNPPNGWGNYEGAVEFLRDVIANAEAHPLATWRVS